MLASLKGMLARSELLFSRRQRGLTAGQNSSLAACTSAGGTCVVVCGWPVVVCGEAAGTEAGCGRRTTNANRGAKGRPRQVALAGGTS